MTSKLQQSPTPNHCSQSNTALTQKILHHPNQSSKSRDHKSSSPNAILNYPPALRSRYSFIPVPRSNLGPRRRNKTHPTTKRCTPVSFSNSPLQCCPGTLLTIAGAPCRAVDGNNCKQRSRKISYPRSLSENYPGFAARERALRKQGRRAGRSGPRRPVAH